jgi:anti-sigma factor RsiW
MRHLDDGLITELVDGEIPSTELGPIQEHLHACAECRARLSDARAMTAEVDGLIESLDDDAPAEAAPAILPFRTPARWPRHLAWAASLVLAVGLGYVGRGAMPYGESPIPAAPLSFDREPETADGPSRAAEPARSAPRSADAPTGARTDVPRSTTPARETAPEAAAGNTAARSSLDREAPPPAELPPAVAPPPSTAASDERTELRDAVTSKQVVGAQQSGARPTPAVIGGTGPVIESGRALRADERQRTAQSLVPRDQVSAPLASERTASPVDTVDLPEAMRRLGGSIKLVDRWVPVRLEAIGGEVVVVYPSAWGSVELRQSRRGDALTWRIVAPATAPADSVAAWRARVRP